MSTERHSAYFRVSERVATIRRSGDTLRRRITSSIDRGGLGWKGESARQALAASLSAHYAQSNGDGHRQALHPDDTNICEEIEENIDGREGENREWGRVLELELDGVYERSDSMEPLRHGEGAEEDTTESYAGWHSLNSRKMRKMRLEEVRDMYSRGERFATIGQKEGQTRKDALKNLPDSRHGHKGHQCSLEPYPSSAPTSLAQPPVTSRSRRPITPLTTHSKFSVWSSDRAISPIVPLNTDQHRLSPALISSSCPSCSASSRSRNRSARGSVQRHRSVNLVQEKEYEYGSDGKPESNDNNVEFPPNHPFHGLDAHQRRSYWNTLSSYYSSSSSATSRDLSFVLRRGTGVQESPASFSPVRCRLLGSLARSHEEIVTRDSRGALTENLSPGVKRLAHSTMGRMSEATSRAVRLVRSEESLSCAVRGEARDKERRAKGCGAGRLRDTFVCRPGAFTPDSPARAIENEVQPADVAAVPRKFGMAYLTRKMRNPQIIWKRPKDEQRRLDGDDQDVELAAAVAANEEATTQCDTRTQTQSTHQALEIAIPEPEPRNEDTTNAIMPVKSSTPPAQLSNGTHHASKNRAPASPPCTPVSPIQVKPTPRSPSQVAAPGPASATPPTEIRTRASSQPPQSHQNNHHHHQRRSVSASSSPSLSDRLRTTRLEDLRLRSETAQEIRNLMLDLDRDRKQSVVANLPPATPAVAAATTITTPQIVNPQSAITDDHDDTRLPGGFTSADLHKKPHPQHISTGSDASAKSVRTALQHHFKSRRQSSHSHNNNNNYENRNNDDNDNHNHDAGHQQLQQPQQQNYYTPAPLRSQSSTWTLPRSYKAPEIHE